MELVTFPFWRKGARDFIPYSLHFWCHFMKWVLDHKLWYEVTLSMKWHLVWNDNGMKWTFFHLGWSETKNKVNMVWSLWVPFPVSTWPVLTEPKFGTYETLSDNIRNWRGSFVLIWPKHIKICEFSEFLQDRPWI